MKINDIICMMKKFSDDELDLIEQELDKERMFRSSHILEEIEDVY